MLISSRDEQSDGEGGGEGDGGRMSDEQLRDEVLTIFLAGYETVANALTWTWLLLGQNPEAEARMHAGGLEPGLNPLSTALEEEGFSDVMSNQVVESFARNFMVALDSWAESGFGAVAKNYLERLAHESGVRCSIDDNGDLLIRRMAKPEPERKAYVAALAKPAWLDPRTKGPRT